jgi:hypothetical protein
MSGREYFFFEQMADADGVVDGALLEFPAAYSKSCFAARRYCLFTHVFEGFALIWTHTICTNIWTVRCSAFRRSKAGDRIQRGWVCDAKEKRGEFSSGLRCF